MWNLKQSNPERQRVECWFPGLYNSSAQFPPAHCQPSLLKNKEKVPIFRAFVEAQMVKSLPAMQKTWVQSLGWEDLPGEGNGNPLQYSVWRVPRTEKPGRLQSLGSQRVGHDWVTNTLTFPIAKSFGKEAEHGPTVWFPHSFWGAL